MKLSKKIIALMLVACLMLPVLAACSGSSQYTSIVVGSTEFNGVFSPFFAITGYDIEVTDYTQLSLYKLDRYANLTSYACEYQTPEEVQIDGKTHVKYTFKLKDGIKFSDGEPITADDIIFTYKVFCDPQFDGLSTMFTLPIVGLKEYRLDTPDYQAKDNELKAKAEAEITDAYVAKYLMDAYGIDEATAMEYVNDPDERPGAVDAYYNELVREFVNSKLSSGASEVPDIAGIKKIDDRTVEVTLNEVSPIAEYQLNIQIMPEHYYGEGFSKGNLDGAKAKNGSPLGAGPYKFVSFENNIVTLEANENYLLGKPKTPTIKYQKVDTQNKVEVVKLGTVDISDPTASPENITDIEADSKLHYELVENLGYGYVGISAKMIPDKNIRKAIMHMMDRVPAIETYYGERASVIERPISKVSWAYPQDAKEYYGYSLDKALEFFQAAGYTQENGILAKNGEQFSIELWVGDVNGEHPVMPMYTQMKIDFEKLGAKCEIMAVEWSVMSEKYTQGLCPVWAAAWGASVDPDMYQVYHSKQIATNNNPYCINNAELDKTIEEARAILDREQRKVLYAKALDIVMEEAVEMPYYQRKNLFLFNQEIINIKTLPENMTPYYGWGAEIEKLQLK